VFQRSTLLILRVEVNLSHPENTGIMFLRSAYRTDGVMPVRHLRHFLRSLDSKECLRKCVLSLTMSHSWEQVRADVMHHSMAHDVTRHWLVSGMGRLEQDRFGRSRMTNLRFESRSAIESMSVPAYIINDILIV